MFADKSTKAEERQEGSHSSFWVSSFGEKLVYRHPNVRIKFRLLRAETISHLHVKKITWKGLSISLSLSPPPSLFLSNCNILSEFTILSFAKIFIQFCSAFCSLRSPAVVGFCWKIINVWVTVKGHTQVSRVCCTVCTNRRNRTSESALCYPYATCIPTFSSMLGITCPAIKFALSSIRPYGCSLDLYSGSMWHRVLPATIHKENWKRQRCPFLSDKFLFYDYETLKVHQNDIELCSYNLL